MAFDLNKFMLSLPDGIEARDLVKLLPGEQWRNHPEHAAIEAMKMHGGFDTDAYLLQYEDVRFSGMDPLSHFVTHGFLENRKIYLKKQISTEKQNDPERIKISVPGEDLDDEHINICFLARGGIGDFLIFFNYLYYFVNQFQSYNLYIDVIFGRGYENAKQFLLLGEIADRIFQDSGVYDFASKYDVFFIISRYPDVVYLDYANLKKKSSALLSYVMECKRFKSEHARYFQYNNVDGQSAAYSQIIGAKRIQQPDIYGHLGIVEKYKYHLAINTDEQYIHHLGLKAGNYITVHRGCDTRYANNSTKMWPLDYYDKLLPLLKSAHPDLKIVQTGVSLAHCGAMSGVDCSLVGQTNMAQLTTILKFSRLHIDNEGGLVHLRHALNAGPSIVLFGPTSEHFFGYSENYNLRGTGCAHWCEWVNKEWTNSCPRGYNQAPCLLSITPKMVMEKVAIALGSG